MIIDAEVHVLPPDWCRPEYEPPAAEDVLRRKIFDHADRSKALAGAHADGLFAEMEAAGIDGAVLIGLPWRTPAQNRANNAYVSALCAGQPERFRGLGVISAPGTADAVDEVRRIDEEFGLSGVKVIPSWQDYRLDDAVFEPVLAEIERRDLILFPHTDHPYLPDVGFDPPHRLMTIAGRHPALRIMAPHLGGLLCLYAHHQPVASVIRNVLFVGSVPLTPAMIGYAVDAVGASRVAFGTDFPFNPSHDQRTMRTAVEGLGFSEEQLASVMSEAVRTFLRWPEAGRA